jgi:hypothetical protein
MRGLALPLSRRPALTWLVGLLIVGAAVVGAYGFLRTAPRNPTAVTNDFVRNLNASNARGLSGDLYKFSPHGLDPGSADPAEILSHAKLPWVVSLLQITDGTAPQIATAHILGTARGERLQLALPLFRKHGRWYVLITTDNAALQSP